jgi:sugar-specific transcriptional regulator TrmB
VVIQSPKDIQELFIKMVKSAKHEVLLVLPTINAFYREERIGIIDLLKDAAEGDQRINVRILTPTNEVVEKKLAKIVSTTEQRGDDGNERRIQEAQMHNKRKSLAIRHIDVASTSKEDDEVRAAERSPVTTVTIVAVDRKNPSS